MTATLTLVAIATRWRVVGDPVVHIDEQFYNLVGARMLHGALPYVDIWDRKPIGLFLIYAFAHLLGGASGVVAGQLLALLCGVGTGLAVFVMARRIAGDGAALAVACLSLVWLTLAGGEAGQSPVFYDLPVAVAFAIIVAARGGRGGATGDFRRAGMAAMLLFGVALQIKYTAVFEGLFAGLLLIWLSWRFGRERRALLADIARWTACAAAPTLIAASCYAARGHGHAWLFANIVSITRRGRERPFTIAMRLAIIVATMAPLVAAVALRRWAGRPPASAEARAALGIVDGWAAAALLGVALFGTWYNHYALPLIPPLATAAAPLGRTTIGRLYLAVLLVYGAAMGQLLISYHLVSRGDANVLAGAARAVRGQRNCLFVYDGMLALYDASGSCLPTTRAFNDHLQSLSEAHATGIDEAAEVRRIMAARPDRVMTMEPAGDQENLAPRAALYAVLARGYRPIWRYPGTSRAFVIYARNGSPGSGRAPIDQARADGCRARAGPGGFVFGRALLDPWRWLAARFTSLAHCPVG